jgi:hypothetical protein
MLALLTLFALGSRSSPPSFSFPSSPFIFLFIPIFCFYILFLLYFLYYILFNYLFVFIFLPFLLFYFISYMFFLVSPSCTCFTFWGVLPHSSTEPLDFSPPSHLQHIAPTLLAGTMVTENQSPPTTFPI